MSDVEIPRPPEEACDEDQLGWFTVELYQVELCWGGPEEGGWWYRQHTRSRRVDWLEVLDRAGALPCVVMTEQEARVRCAQGEAALQQEIRRHLPSLSSVRAQPLPVLQWRAGDSPDLDPAIRPVYR